MSRKVGDINAKLAYLTNHKTGPILKMKRPMVLRKTTSFGTKRSSGSPCLSEFSALMDCINKHDKNLPCMEKLLALQKCRQTHQESNAKKLVDAKNGKKIDGSYHPDVVAKIVEKYPVKLNRRQYQQQKNLLNTHKEIDIKILPFTDKGRPFNKR